MTNDRVCFADCLLVLASVVCRSLSCGVPISASNLKNLQPHSFYLTTSLERTHSFCGSFAVFLTTGQFYQTWPPLSNRASLPCPFVQLAHSTRTFGGTVSQWQLHWYWPVIQFNWFEWHVFANRVLSLPLFKVDLILPLFNCPCWCSAGKPRGVTSSSLICLCCFHWGRVSMDKQVLICGEGWLIDSLFSWRSSGLWMVSRGRPGSRTILVDLPWKHHNVYWRDCENGFDLFEVMVFHLDVNNGLVLL